MALISIRCSPYGGATQNKILITLAGVIIAVIVLIVLVFLHNGSGTPQNAISVGSQGQLATDPNFFAGNVTTQGISPGTYNGTGVYDHNCLPVGNGIYSCDAGIKTAKYGTIEFAYRHDMMMKPCIGPGDVVTVTILNSSGSATVSRMSNPTGYT